MCTKLQVKHYWFSVLAYLLPPPTTINDVSRRGRLPLGSPANYPKGDDVRSSRQFLPHTRQGEGLLQPPRSTFYIEHRLFHPPAPRCCSERITCLARTIFTDCCRCSVILHVSRSFGVRIETIIHTKLVSAISMSRLRTIRHPLPREKANVCVSCILAVVTLCS